MDTRMPSTGFRLLFGTPLFSTTLEHAEQLNDELAELIDHEQRDAAGARRSMAGEASFRTDDHFLKRPEAAVRSLHSALLVHAERALQYGQPRRLRLELELHGWAISHGHGGSQVPHVHPIAQWSGVYYVRAILQPEPGAEPGPDPDPARSTLAPATNPMRSPSNPPRPQPQSLDPYRCACRGASRLGAPVGACASRTRGLRP